MDEQWVQGVRVITLVLTHCNSSADLVVRAGRRKLIRVSVPLGWMLRMYQQALCFCNCHRRECEMVAGLAGLAECQLKRQQPASSLVLVALYDVTEPTDVLLLLLL